MGFFGQSQHIHHRVTEAVIRTMVAIHQVGQVHLPTSKQGTFLVMLTLFDHAFEQQIHQLIQLLLNCLDLAGSFLHLFLVENLLHIAGVLSVGDHIFVNIIINAHSLEYLLYFSQNSILAYPHTLAGLFRIPAHQVSKFSGITVAIFADFCIGRNGLSGGGASKQPTEDVIFPRIGKRLFMPA